MHSRYASLLLAVSLTAANVWPQSPAAFEVFLPHIADGIISGTAYRTTFILVNPGREPAELTLELTGDDGNPLELRLFERGALAGQASQFNFRIPAGGSRVFETSGSGGGQVGAARIVSGSRIVASGIFSILDMSGTVVTEAGIGSSPPLQDFRLPVDVTGTFNTGVALFNPGQDTANATIELFNSAGASVGRTDLRLPPKNHVARFADQFFQLAGPIEGSLRVSSNAPLAAIAIRMNSAPLAFTTLPVVGEHSLQTSFNLPQIANGTFPGGRYRTSFMIFSLSGTEAAINIRLTDDDGNPFEAPIRDLGSNSNFDLVLPGNSSRFLKTTGDGPLRSGSARITSSVPVGVSAAFSIFSGQDNFVTETGVGDSPPHSAATLPVSVTNNFDTGMALFNPKSTPVDVSMTVVDNSGRRVSASGNSQQALQNIRITLAPGGHLARFVSNFFGGLSDFNGTLGIAASDEISILTLRQNNASLSLTTLPVEPGARAPVGGEGTLLNEVGFVSDAAHPQFVELKVAEGFSQLAQGLQLVTGEGGVYNLPPGAQFSPQSRLVLILFDAQNRIEGSTIHADRTGFLNPASGFVALLNRDGLLLDRIGWGPGQRGAARLGRGGLLYDLLPGSSIARLPESVQEMAFGEWASFSPERATPGSLNTLPEVGVLMPLSGAIAAGPDITLSWYPVPGIRSYRVQVSGEKTFQTTAVDVETSTSLLALTGFQPGEYFWRVQGRTSGGQAAGWSPVGSFDIQATTAAASPLAMPMMPQKTALAADGSPLADPVIADNAIDVPLIPQKKDTSMLLLEADEDRGGNHRWDDPHPWTDPDDPADNMNCMLATVVMVNRYYGGRLSQDRLGYEFLKDIGPRGPEWDLVYGAPGFNADHHLSMLFWALQPSVQLVTSRLTQTPEGLDEFWNIIKTSVDSGRPIVLWLDEQVGGSPAHAVVIHGYLQIGNTRSVRVRDPWQTGSFSWPLRSLEKTPWSRGYWIMPPREQTNPRSDEASVSADSDRDGVMDFDETNRFKTNANRSDSDGDLIGDYLEIRGSVFDPEHGYWLKVHKTWDSNLDFLRDRPFWPNPNGFDPQTAGSSVRDDFDGDGKHMELDYDSDGGGCSDGFEDSNWNGMREDNERSNFSARDDKCHIQGYEKRTLTVPRSSFKLSETLTETVFAEFCAGPPVLLNGATTSAPNRVTVDWTRKTVFKYEAQNFFCAQAFTATYDFGTVGYSTNANGGTSAVRDGITVLISPMMQGIEAFAHRDAPGSCEKYTSGTSDVEKWDAQFGMWFGVGAGTVTPWNFAFLVPWSGLSETKTFQSGQASSYLNIWFVDRSEAEAAKPCLLRN